MRYFPARSTGILFFSFILPCLVQASTSSHGDKGQVIFVSIIGIVAGIILFFVGFSKLGTERLMKNIPFSTIRAMAQGLVEINGWTMERELLQSPMTNKSCVYYECKLEELVSSGKSSHWETIQSESSNPTPFFLQDDTASTVVYPEGATVIIPNELRQQTGTLRYPSPELEQYLQARNISETGLIFEKTLRFTERCIFPGERLFVMGTCKDNIQPPPVTPDGGTGNGQSEGDHSRLCVGKSEGEEAPFYISHESQKELEGDLSWQAFGCIFGGIAMIGFFLCLLLGVINR